MTRPEAPLDDLTAIQAKGVNTIVSLLEPAEANHLGLGEQAAICAKLGLTFLSHPIRDMHLPEPQRFCVFAEQVAARLRDGADIAIHCRASIGRSGMLACTVLSHFGYEPGAAIAHISAKRAEQIPDTEAQTAFIHKISAARTS